MARWIAILYLSPILVLIIQTDYLTIKISKVNPPWLHIIYLVFATLLLKCYMNRCHFLGGGYEHLMWTNLRCVPYRWYGILNNRFEKLNKSYNRMSGDVIQSSAVMTRCNIVRYYINDYRDWCRKSVRCWIHNRHPKLRPNRWAVGCFCEYLWQNLTRYNGTAMYLISDTAILAIFTVCIDS